MMRLLALFLIIIPFYSFNQTSEVTITVSEFVSKQGLPGARVILSDQFKAKSDIEGTVVFQQVPYGSYQLTVMAVSFDTVFVNVDVNGPVTSVEVPMGGIELKEIKLIGNSSIGRKTPVPVTTLNTQKITEELGSRDIPMLLNSTPGVYATNQGGGDGDSRITVRGFDQRNVGVMIDGVPVNDMENGSVYWSNWFGLDAITSSIQVQRGLGATKLAMPSIGGTINILTQGVGNKKGLTLRQEVASGDFTRTSLSYNSGMLKNGFGVTLSGSYKRGDGWVDGTPTEGAFFYLKVQKKIKNHLLSLSGFAAPQQHGQRSFNQQIQYWDSDYAREQGVNVTGTGNDKGFRYNEHWGYISSHTNGSTVKGNQRNVLNERLNYYNKPQITLKDFWQVNSKLAISNLAYASIGRGGGTKLSNYSAALRKPDGTIDWDQIVYNNQYTSFFGTVTPNIDPYYSNTEFKSNQIISASVNNHFWVGYLGQFSYELSKSWSFSGGVDYRNYKGTHYQEVKDLLGGGYATNFGNQNQASAVKIVGDKIASPGKPYENYRDGLVQWAGVFGQAEYAATRWTAFINLSGVYNGYKGVDYFQKKVLEVGDTTLRIGATDTIQYGGQTYTASSDGLKDFSTEWKWIPGFTFKTGASYILTENASIFMNLGYLSRTPTFSNVVDNNTNTFFQEIMNEKVVAIEGGYAYASKNWGINVNGYATNWKNKPIPFGVAIPDPLDPTSTIRVNINGMDALHLGGEVDLAWKITTQLSAELMASYGDWTWRSKETVYIAEIQDSISFDARGVHVGDAAQSMYSVSLRYEPFKRFYVKAQYMYFDRYYAQFSPFDLNGENSGHESWKLPGYGLLNLFVGYRYKLKKSELLFNGIITNVLNSKNIADATDNYYGSGFDAASASVMFGQGFRFSTSVAIQF
jgi:iron complex outermembrane receptor protein